LPPARLQPGIDGTSLNLNGSCSTIAENSIPQSVHLFNFAHFFKNISTPWEGKLVAAQAMALVDLQQTPVPDWSCLRANPP
jgi:hypothetical protein